MLLYPYELMRSCLQEVLPEIENGALWEVEEKWVVKGAVDVDIGTNPSVEGGEGESVDDQAVKVVDIVDTFRLQEQPPFDKKQFIAHIKNYIKSLTAKLEGKKQEEFKKTIEGQPSICLLRSKTSNCKKQTPCFLPLVSLDLLLIMACSYIFVGESMHDDSTLVFAYYKEGAVDPTFLYFGHGLKEIKC
ncbi:hypothetical protein Pfo_020529 [Paulownia fortunei]|nr:hypothetical protein Pfo_020529 [Paulownia fortunei]